MASTSDSDYVSAATAATTASTIYSFTTHIDWGSKVWDFFFIVSNDEIWLHGFALGFNVGSTSQITFIVGDPSANLLEVSSLCGLNV